MTVEAPAQPISSVTYEQDHQRWIEQQAALLRSGRVQHLDLANLAEEMDDMGKRRKRALKSTLTVILQHLLKYQHQPERRGASWRLTLVEHRQRLRDDFADSPSLKPYAATILDDCYQDARVRASAETGLAADDFPAYCPYDWARIMDIGFLPD